MLTAGVPGQSRSGMLITVRGVDLLRPADLVVFDAAVSPRLLENLAPSAESIGVVAGGSGRLGSGEVERRMIEAAREGRTVVRLQGGGPGFLGCCSDEVEVFSREGVPYEIVPGVTAGLAAVAYAGVPLATSRQPSVVTLVAQGKLQERPEAHLDLAAFAALPGTLIFSMDAELAQSWSENLIRCGKPPDTPVAVVCRCTESDQRTIRCSLGTLSGAIAAGAVRSPAVIVVGEVVSMAPVVSWFAARPLFGTRILVTRPREQAETLGNSLTELGAEVLLQPAIEISEPADWSPLDRAIATVDRYDWIVFSSANGVRAFLKRLWESRGDLRRLGSARLAAIGPATAEELGRERLRGFGSSRISGRGPCSGPPQGVARRTVSTGSPAEVVICSQKSFGPQDGWSNRWWPIRVPT